MTDSDRIYAAIAGLREEIMREFRDRRSHVDSELRRVHDRIDDLDGKIEPLTLFANSRTFFWKTVSGFALVCAAIGGVLFAALKYFGA